MSNYPDWVLAHKRSGSEIKSIKGHYYLYETSSKWNVEKQRAQKKSGKIIGKITPNGLIESRRRIDNAEATSKSVANMLLGFEKIETKEYGLSYFMEHEMATHIEKLQQYFPRHWQWILAIAYCRLAHHSPIKRMPHHLANSFLSEIFLQEPLTEKRISQVLNEIGIDRAVCSAYMQSFVGVGDHLMVDMTNLTSQSSQIPLAKRGYNSKLNFDPQFNLLYIYSAKLKSPVFYRLVAGNLRETKAVKILLQESQVKDCTFIADKGFYSQENVQYLTAAQLSYIIPLKRNTALIEKESLSEESFKAANQYFDFDDRYIWYQIFDIENEQKVYLFLNDGLKTKEQADYLNRIKSLPESHSIEQFHLKRPFFGTLALATNLKDMSAADMYKTYKSRCDIEQMFDHLKTVLHADTSYMQNEQTLQGWMFANHVALQCFYSLFHLIVQAQKLKKCSVQDIIETLKEIRKIKINNLWLNAERTTSTKNMLKNLNIHIP